MKNHKTPTEQWNPVKFLITTIFLSKDPYILDIKNCISK